MRDAIEESINSSMNWILVPDDDPIKIMEIKEMNILEYFRAVIHKLEYLTSKFNSMKK